MSFTRRSFLTTLSAASAAALFNPETHARSLIQSQGIRFGYAQITWGDKIEDAIRDVSALGFRGIQLRANVVPTYESRPEALRDLLRANRLELVALSSGAVTLDAPEADEIAKHTRHAKFMRAVGGKYLQLTDAARPKTAKPAADDYQKLGRRMSEIAKRVSDLGIGVGYHNHMNTLGEAPDEVSRIMDAADPKHLKFLLDIAHYAQGGGDPARAVREYKDRLLFLHIKDVQSPVPAVGTHTRNGAPGAQNSYRFVELGQGKVDIPAVFDALRAVKFNGWAVVELDRVPDDVRTPKESGEISKRYIQERLRLKI